jgi:tyrosyl-DNA phosphodiesterase-1
MTQAAWRSPLLPLLSSKSSDNVSNESETTTRLIGSGERFQIDFLRYLKAYGKRITSLTAQLLAYDFSAIRAAFIGSAPSRQKPAAAKPSEQTSFGWLGLRETLSAIPIVDPDKTASTPHIVIQVSSIATLGAAPTWLTHFQSVLSRSYTNTPPAKDHPSTFFSKLPCAPPPLPPTYSIVFPTPSEIRSSLDGYASGASIHTKLQSAQQQKQLEYTHSLFCHWNAPSEQQRGEAHRGLAAPHIKTYVRFRDTTHKRIDWALLTSANLSKQAWGDVVNKKDEVWIQSWEAGVVVWPGLFGEEGKVAMVPVFGGDMPGEEDVEENDGGSEDAEGIKTVVGFRMPYNVPLHPYAADEKPWCATVRYAEPDWKGLAWGGY